MRRNGPRRMLPSIIRREIRMKCEALQWQIDTTQKTIVAKLSFDDFDQSMRFMSVLTSFIMAERKPRPILDDIAWYYPPADTGSVT